MDPQEVLQEAHRAQRTSPGCSNREPLREEDHHQVILTTGVLHQVLQVPVDSPATEVDLHQVTLSIGDLLQAILSTEAHHQVPQVVHQLITYSETQIHFSQNDMGSEYII